MVPDVLVADLPAHFPFTARGETAGPETPGPVDAHLAGSVGALGVVADEVAGVVLGEVLADGGFDLGDDGEGGEEVGTGGTLNAVLSYGIKG